MVSKDLILTVEGAENGTNDIPTFSLDELNRCKGVMLGGGAFGKVYAIEGFPGFAVKEVRLDDQPDRLKEITKFELETLSRFSSATRCLRTMTSYTSSWTVMMGICNTLSLITEGLASPFPES
ncbi:Ankyrin repeat protein [Giardia duodenalis assemblage B]|uniref:Ankyrin repeat protein n=1 Tax=Giardia duodenalis assemblage B TaxID=1394984 RepID=A0A132NQJ2_GIAIN|nr:Ankyrin repeat protein [Giardia intestinalis assemblage B]